MLDHVHQENELDRCVSQRQLTAEIRSKHGQAGLLGQAQATPVKVDRHDTACPELAKDRAIHTNARRQVQNETAFVDGLEPGSPCVTKPGLVVWVIAPRAFAG